MNAPYWTYAAGADGVATFRAHASLDHAEYHYSMMRAIGGPKRIGLCRKPRTVKTLLRELAKAKDEFPNGYNLADGAFSEALRIEGGAA